MDIGSLVGLSREEAKERGYVFKNDPVVRPLGGELGEKLGLALAINTAQYGRTFQDRYTPCLMAEARQENFSF